MHQLRTASDTRHSSSSKVLKGCSICNPVHQKPQQHSASSFTNFKTPFHFCLLTFFYQMDTSYFCLSGPWPSKQALCFSLVKIWHRYFKPDFYEPQNCNGKSVGLLPLVGATAHSHLFNPCLLPLLLYKNGLQKHHFSTRSHISPTRDQRTSFSQRPSRETLHHVSTTETSHFRGAGHHHAHSMWVTQLLCAAAAIS